MLLRYGLVLCMVWYGNVVGQTGQTENINIVGRTGDNGNVVGQTGDNGNKQTGQVNGDNVRADETDQVEVYSKDTFYKAFGMKEGCYEDVYPIFAEEVARHSGYEHARECFNKLAASVNVVVGMDSQSIACMDVHKLNEMNGELRELYTTIRQFVCNVIGSRQLVSKLERRVCLDMFRTVADYLVSNALACDNVVMYKLYFLHFYTFNDVFIFEKDIVSDHTMHQMDGGKGLVYYLKMVFLFLVICMVIFIVFIVFTILYNYLSRKKRPLQE